MTEIKRFPAPAVTVEAKEGYNKICSCGRTNDRDVQVVPTSKEDGMLQFGPRSGALHNIVLCGLSVLPNDVTLGGAFNNPNFLEYEYCI